MRIARGFSIAVLALACAGGATWWWQRQLAVEMRGEIEFLRDENRELAGLLAENRRLAAALPPAATLATWRADHAAIGRLRGEIERLKADVEARERALAK